MSNVVIVSGPVIVQDGKVLLNKHGDDSFWKFCGGRVEDFDLGLLETARREAREEMGANLEILDPQPFLLYTAKETAAGHIEVILVHYLAQTKDEIRPGADIREWAWLDIADIAQEDLAPNIMPTLRHFGFIK